MGLLIELGQSAYYLVWLTMLVTLELTYWVGKLGKLCLWRRDEKHG